MKAIIVSGSPTEIAALVVGLQERREKVDIQTEKLKRNRETQGSNLGSDKSWVIWRHITSGLLCLYVCIVCDLFNRFLRD